ncbi:hypothetical protein Kpol_1059p6 [Vanderwaltozyma polyspora DSM 70294]|uniref:HIT-type domain-containing protein n=1 Tax=Vanderwaltozyma polyspora (strain ATCC 22028 / DSM 70294 / BCRC 21397 / CBS 2163 / NBRC 10782 / NRRL Y-8283 / UCD 57-17) TaxID=436907 RepID=A7TN10_VANPO|nr:uncharacterized protein Kpol_1059p6 [Vanderwaltozyma polyspora DSM 70294]EDO16316.1 hypothetical protein Kpol_1059p6 [Vanderwaltozyma polyspora DSM 70294]
MEKCAICEIEISKYKCPKCGIRYCSLTCYKNEDKHKHTEETVVEQTKVAIESVNKDCLNDDSGDNVLRTPELNAIYKETPELRELLKYNTVKFHLHKVYKILSTNVVDSNENNSNLNSDSRKQLALDYLNTLLYGGIHHNEAVEEFCQIALEKISHQ